VYESAQLVEERRLSIVHIAALFDLLMQQPDLLPAAYLEESAGVPLHRQVCDYIAGMTDGFFARKCVELGIS
jgi:dGTPase